MQTEIREISPVLVEVTVEVPWDRVHKDLNDTYREIGKTARVRGFRPGKVPKNVLKQVYGRQAAAQVTGALVEQCLMQAVQEHELHIVAQPEIEEAPELEQGKPLTFKAKVEVRPKIDEVVTDGIEVWQKPIDIPDEDIDKEIEQLRNQHSEIQVPDPIRPAQEGDLITIDYTVTVDGEAKEDLGAEGRQVEIVDEHLLPALKEGLVGMKPDDEKTVDIDFEGDHPNPDLQGKTAQFTIRAKELHEKLLPDLDDEFAKDCGDYETLLELRLKIREGLEGSAKQRGDAELKDQLIEALIQANDIPVPPSMVQQQQQMMMYEMAQFMQMAGQQGAPGADFFSGIEERAQRRVQAGILLGSLARQEGIDVSEADLDAKFQEIADQTGKHVAKVRADYQEAQRDALESQLLEEKVMALLTERAKIHEGERPEPEAKGEE
ncbi:MAG: trigger factor [Deltaproteobacteria bacterium]|nr:trigger factor [Deltaproteobacteria bacterium]MBW2379162.1 trigger factor [Deltaproteobacteria bacterium]MBW2686098.1 trigger factor [Deltaproteobacteria bacterium]